MKLNPTVFNRQAFLTSYWQQRPVVLKQGLDDFVDPVAPEILAGLAMEEGVDARVVQCQQPDAPLGWKVTHGPFSDYEALGESHWTLLVQSVNEWLPDVGELLTAFNFLPEWRVDDVMVSFSCEDGGVGPHLDQYDVFIIQGQGRRRWRVGDREAINSFQPCADLTLIEQDFTAVIDEVLEPGDILYIPAGCPHDGIALEPSLNYSVGFRAPSQAELLLQVGDLALQHDVFTRRYQDPELSANNKHFVVDQAQLQQAKQLLTDAMSANTADDLLMRVFSQSKRPLVEPELPYTAEQVPELLRQQGAVISRAPGARWLHCKVTDSFYSNGERFEMNSKVRAFALALAAIQQEQSASGIAELCDNAACADMFAELLNMGTFAVFLDSD